MSQYIKDDLEGDVIAAEGEANPEPKEPEDRGDKIDPELAVENSKELAKEEIAPAVVADESDAKPMPSHIPKARFDKVNHKKNELQEALAEANRVIESLRAPKVDTKVEPNFDEDAKEQAYIDAFMEGDVEAAKVIRREINAHQREQMLAEVESRNAQRQEFSLQQQAESALQAEADRSFEAYPYLNTEEGAEATELIIALRDSKIAKGVAMDVALREAVAKIAPLFSPEGNGKVLQSGEISSRKTDSRSAAATARGAADSMLQPPSVQVGTGNRATAGRVNVAGMSDDQFENLSLAEKKQLRGDA